MTAFDTIIRGGSVVDGTGAPAFTADVAVRDGRIVEVGRVSGTAGEVIDADGALVTPGFLDIHTHYDGQAVWDDTLEPSFGHGVTTVVAGNCGVGFAPVLPEHQRALVELMEGVEDIPDVVIEEGLDWRWRTFADYLDRLAENRWTMDVAVQLTHAPVRVFIMGERALRHEAATPDDIAAMAQLVQDGMAAGAAGFSGARNFEHHPSGGGFVPGTFAGRDELLALAGAMGAGGRGTFQLIPLGSSGETADTTKEDLAARQAEHDLIVELAVASGRPVTYTLTPSRSDPEDWQAMLAASERSTATGRRIAPQVGGRGIGALTTLDGYHIFMLRPSYVELRELPLAERVVALRDPERRARILAESTDPSLSDDPKLAPFLEMLRTRIAGIYPLSLPLDYEPTPERTLGALAAAAGAREEDFLYDHYTAGDGRNACASFFLNYATGSLDATYEMLSHPDVALGLADGGAHMRFACDASMPTFALTFWARDRVRGPRLPLEHVVQKLTSTNAELYGLGDRGAIAVGMRADLNVIDHERLALHLPEMVFDLPSGGQRLTQRADGYLATIVAGTTTRRDDADTGARPGRLIRFGAAR